MPPATGPTHHASCILLGAAGILLRGPSGAGKSAAAIGLVEQAAARGLFAALVADDRVRLSVHAGRLVARPAAALAGLVEIRGIGVAAQVHEPAAVVRLVVDIVPATEMPRLPEACEERTILLGIELPRLASAADRLLLTRLRRRLAADTTRESAAGEACVCSAT